MPKYVICPFFKYERKGYKICCQERKPLKLKNKQEYDNLLDNYCCVFNYKNCEYAKQMLEKYSNEKENEDER